MPAAPRVLAPHPVHSIIEVWGAASGSWLSAISYQLSMSSGYQEAFGPASLFGHGT